MWGLSAIRAGSRALNPLARGVGIHLDDWFSLSLLYRWVEDVSLFLLLNVRQR